MGGCKTGVPEGSVGVRRRRRRRRRGELGLCREGAGLVQPAFCQNAGQGCKKMGIGQCHLVTRFCSGHQIWTCQDRKGERRNNLCGRVCVCVGGGLRGLGRGRRDATRGSRGARQSHSTSIKQELTLDSRYRASPQDGKEPWKRWTLWASGPGFSAERLNSCSC